MRRHGVPPIYYAYKSHSRESLVRGNMGLQRVDTDQAHKYSTIL